MAYIGFVGSGHVGNFQSTVTLELIYPAQRNAGRKATVETAGVVAWYFSTGANWVVISSAQVRIVGTRGEVALSQAQSNTTNKLRCTGRIQKKTGRVATMTIGVTLDAYYLDAARAELSLANGYVARAHIEIPGAPTPVVTMSWNGGATSATVPAGSSDYPSDLASCTAFGYPSGIPAGTIYYEVVEKTVALNEYINISVAPQESGEGCTYGSGATSAIGVAGALVNQEGGAVATGSVCSAATIGTTATPQPCAIFFGDSLVFGFKDGGPGAVGGGGGILGGGMFPRAAWDIGSGYALPWARQARTGTTAQQAVANYTKQSGIWKYATHLLCDLGTNDLNAGQSAAATLANLRTLWAAAKTAGLQRVEQMKIINRCSSSTDAWATVANQTILTGFENGGSKKDPLNASILSNVGSNGLDAILVMDSGWADPTVTDKIVAPGGTDDGVHLLPATAATVAASAVTRFAAWTAI